MRLSSLPDFANRRKLNQEKEMSIKSLVVLAITLSLIACSKPDHIPLNVELGTRAVSKLPFVIAEDQGLYAKHGLAVSLRMPDPTFEDGRKTHSNGPMAQLWRRALIRLGLAEEWVPDVFVDGLTPNIVKEIDNARFPHYVAVASNDCDLRAHIVVRPGIESVEQLKGKRIGISARRDTTTGFGALTLAERMGWHPVNDISIKYGGRDVEALNEGLVDAIVASEVRYAVATLQGLNALVDTKEWNVSLAGNSAMVEKEWLADSKNHEAVRRLIRALSEGLAIFHNNRQLSVEIFQKWHGIPDRRIAEIAYERGRWMPRKPYPCYVGIENTFALYDSNEMRRYAPEDFYEDRFVREADESGFYDELYQVKPNGAE